jgi:hypothetical protein
VVQKLQGIITLYDGVVQKIETNLKQDLREILQNANIYK